MTPESLVSIIIVTYNSASYILPCLRSVEVHTRGIPYEIIVIDNGSTDNTIRLIAEFHTSVKLLPVLENLGFAGACNRAVSASRGGYLWFLNPDTALQNNAAQILFAHVRSQELSGKDVIGGALLVDGTGVPAKSYGAFPQTRKLIVKSIGRSLFLLRALANLGEKAHPIDIHGPNNKPTGPFTVPFVSGASMLIARRLFMKYDGFDERFFMYAEEADLQFTAHQDGVISQVCPDARIYHREAGSFSVSRVQWAMLEISYRRFMEKNGSWFDAALSRTVLPIVRFGEILLEGLYRNVLSDIAFKGRFLAKLAMRRTYGTSRAEYLSIIP
jgi:GT2 family glycosyltransferase